MTGLIILILYAIPILPVARLAMMKRMDEQIWVKDCKSPAHNDLEQYGLPVFHTGECGYWVVRGAKYGRSDVDFLSAIVCGLLWIGWIPVFLIKKYVLAAPLTTAEKELRAKNLQQTIDHTRRELEKLEKEHGLK